MLGTLILYRKLTFHHHPGRLHPHVWELEELNHLYPLRQPNYQMESSHPAKFLLYQHERKLSCVCVYNCFRVKVVGMKIRNSEYLKIIAGCNLFEFSRPTTAG